MGLNVKNAIDLMKLWKENCVLIHSNISTIKMTIKLTVLTVCFENINIVRRYKKIQELWEIRANSICLFISESKQWFWNPTALFTEYLQEQASYWYYSKK